MLKNRMKNPSRPSPAMVVAIIALIAAVGGSAYAAKKIGTKQLKNKSVSTKKLKNNAVTKAKIKDGAVAGSKLGNVIVRKITDTAEDGTVASATAECQGSEKMIGGGTRFVGSGAAQDLLLISSGPRKSATDNAAPDEGGPLVAWRGAGVNLAGTTGDRDLTVFAICLQ